MKNFLIYFHLFLNFLKFHNCKPLPFDDAMFHEINNTTSLCESNRVRRSLPEFDAANPAYLEAEEEEPLSFPEHVSNLFRNSNRRSLTNNNAQKVSIVRPVPGDRAMQVVKEDDTLEDEKLRTDEQENCYKQQNIEPPGVLEKRSKIDRQIMKQPLAGIGHGSRVSYVSTDKLLKGKNHKPKESEDSELLVYSLYAEPENISRYQTLTKNTNRYHKSPRELDKPIRVYKPVEVHPKFPVYDEDIDFHPDPLQGILDDKYWLDPQEQEAVIRKYIDLAAHNMMPLDTNIEKRSAMKSESKVETGIKDTAKICSCLDSKELAFCKDCKGKGQQNYTTSDDRVSNETKHFLSSDYEGQPEFVENGKENLQFYENNSDSSNRLPSPLVEYGVGKEEDENANDLNNYVFKKRNILSYGEDDQSYDEEIHDEDKMYSNEHNPELDKPVYIHNFAENEYQHYFKSDIEPEDQRVLQRFEPVGIKSENHEQNQFKTNQYSVPQKYALFSLTNKPPAYYKPNKIANVLQKPLQEKPKTTKKPKEFDPNREFELLQNAAIANLTLENATKRAENSSNTIAYLSTSVPHIHQDINKFVNENIYDFGESNLIKSRQFEALRSNVHHNARYSNGGNKYKVSTKIPKFNLMTDVPRENVYDSKTNQWYEKSLLLPTENNNINWLYFNSSKSNRNYFKPHDYLRYNLNDNDNDYISSNNNRTLKKRWDDRKLFAHKGRRSFADPGYKYNLVSLSQDPEKEVKYDNIHSGSGEMNQTSQSLDVASQNNASTVNNTLGASSKNMHPVVETTTANLTTKLNKSVTKKPKNKEVEKEEDVVDTEIAKDIVDSVIRESQRSSVLGHHLGLCRRNESLAAASYGRVVPETERVIKEVTNCIMDRLKSHLEKQRCVLLDVELLEFLKWMVLTGESYKDYLMKQRSLEIEDTQKSTTCRTQTKCDIEMPPPIIT